MNLGQYTSFNNVIRYCETELVAVQDGDDISCPQRLHRAANQLRLSGADIHGGSLVEFNGNYPATEDLGIAVMDRALKKSQNSRDPGFLHSQYPVWQGAIEHFLFNGTAVMRTGVFRALNGFSDHGNVPRNRCNMDTEFYARFFL